MPSEMKRHKAWLQRGEVKGEEKAWRPKTVYRVAARKWADVVDLQLRTSTVVSGLAHFLPNDRLPIWSDWRTWPGLGISKDQGSDGEASFWALSYHFGLNVWQWPDFSHGVNRDIDLTLKHCNLFGFWLCMLISWNLPFGPDRDDLRYCQIRAAMTAYFKHNTSRSAVLFQEMAPMIIQEHEQAGIAYPGDGPVDELCWKFLSSRQHFAKVGRRTNLNRFCGSLETAEFNLPHWTTDLMERTYVALEQDMLKGKAFLNHFKLKAGLAETVTEEGGPTSSKRLTMEDSREGYVVGWLTLWGGVRCLWNRVVLAFLFW